MRKAEQHQSASVDQAGTGNRVSQTQNHQPVTLSVTLAAPERAPWLSIQSVRIEVCLQPSGEQP